MLAILVYGRLSSAARVAFGGAWYPHRRALLLGGYLNDGQLNRGTVDDTIVIADLLLDGEKRPPPVPRPTKPHDKRKDEHVHKGWLGGKR